MLKLVQGLTGAVFAVSAFMLPVTGFAEEAAMPQKYVMPQEQVYLDPSQAEAAKQQLEADAFYNANPQNNVPVAAAEKKEVAEENAAGIKEEKATETAQQQVNTVAAEQKQETPAPQKYVMPQQQVYLDPSQTEAAKQQTSPRLKMWKLCPVTGSLRT